MTLEALRAEVSALIDRLATGGTDAAARDAVLLSLLKAQAAQVTPYGQLLAARGAPSLSSLADYPALPTDVFRFARVASHSPSEDLRSFVSSGTTQDSRSVHAFRNLSLYDKAAQAAARHALFFDTRRMRLVILAPTADVSPHSSLSYMLSRFDEWFGDGGTCWPWHNDALDIAALTEALERAEAEDVPVALLGTSFAFVHADDALGGRRFSLPQGSRLMQTGGYKGRSRAIEPAEMRALLSARYGVPEQAIVAEYGMTELSSQLYETTLRWPERPRRLWAPGWMRVAIVHPETLAPLEDGEVGVVRIDDAANVDSVCAIQTADLGRISEGGLELLGRAPGSVARGCSLAAEQALRGERP